MNELNISISVFAFIVSVISLILHYRKPKLKLEYEDKSPYKKLAMDLNSNKSYPIELFIRAKIKSTKFILAKNVICKITMWYTNSKFIKEFDPIKLHWVSNDIDDYSGVDLSKNEFEYIDILRTKRDLDKIIIYSNTHPRATPIEFSARDEHIFKLSVYCNNGNSISEWFKVVYQEHDKKRELAWISMEKVSKNTIKKLSSTSETPNQRFNSDPKRV